MPDIVDAGRLAGQACWIEQRLFEILGGWVADTARGNEPELARMLADHAHHHSWHAELWRDRLPELAEHPPAEANRPRSEAVADVVDAVADAESSIDRLVGVYRVLLPRLVADYDAALQTTSALTDGPTARVLKLCLADLRDDQRDGEDALETLIGSSGAATTADARQASLAARADAAGRLTD